MSDSEGKDKKITHRVPRFAGTEGDIPMCLKRRLSRFFRAAGLSNVIGKDFNGNPNLPDSEYEFANDPALKKLQKQALYRNAPVVRHIEEA